MPPSPNAASRSGRIPFLLLGGIPGAGKTTALAQLAALTPGVRVLDSDAERRRLTRLLPGLPYAWLRPAVHAIHQVRILVLLVAGPGSGAELVVHDPSTRWVRLGLVGLLARLRGWYPVVVFVDVDREQALLGQWCRRRLVGRRRFEAHWRRWQGLRAALTAAPGEQLRRRWVWALTPWRARSLTSRQSAGQDLVAVLSSPGPVSIRADARSVGETMSNGG